MITVTRYRILLLASIAVSLLGGILSFALESTLPPELQAYLARIDAAPTSTLALLAGAGGLMALLIAGIVITVALYRFKRWSRPGALILTALALPLGIIIGPFVEPAATQTLYDLGTLLWGAALAAAYWSPVASRFEERPVAA